MRVLAIDPGERVGWNTATILDHCGKGGGARLEVGDYGILRLKDFALALDGEGPAKVPDLRPEHFDVVIFETWILTRKGAQDSVGSEMESSQVVGQIRSAVWRAPNHPRLVRQAPRDMTTGRLALNNPRPDYAAIAAIIDAAPASHKDSHYVSSLLHTVKFFHKEFA
jgi:hypothetical protein